jgi:cation transport ATPase
MNKDKVVKMDSTNTKYQKDNDVQNELTVTQANVFMAAAGDPKAKSAVPRVVTDNISSSDALKLNAVQQNIDLKLSRPSLQLSDTKSEPDEIDSKNKWYRLYYSKKWAFFHLVMIIICIFMCLWGIANNDALGSILYIMVELGIALVLVIDTFWKMVLRGWKKYWKQIANIVDLLLITCTILAYIGFISISSSQNIKILKKAPYSQIFPMIYSILQIFRICKTKSSQNKYGVENTKKSEKKCLANHRENGSNPEGFKENTLKLDLEEGNKENEVQHNYSDIKLNLSGDAKNFEPISKLLPILISKPCTYRCKWFQFWLWKWKWTW